MAFRLLPACSFLLLLVASQGIQMKPLKSLLRTGRLVPKDKTIVTANHQTLLAADADTFALELEQEILADLGLKKLGLKKVEKVDPEAVAGADQAKLKEAFIPQCTAKLEDLYDKYYERAQYQGPEGEEQMGHTLATHFAYNCNQSYPIKPEQCNLLSTSLMNLVNDHKPIMIPNVTSNGTQIVEGACLESIWPNNTGVEAEVKEGKRVVVYDVNVSKCFGDVFIHYAAPDPVHGTPFLPMSAQEGAAVHTYVAVVLPLDTVNDYSTRVGTCAKPPAAGLSTWNLTFSVAAINRPNATCPEGGAAPAAAFLQRSTPADHPPPPALEPADAAAPAYNNGEEWCAAFFDQYTTALAAEKK